MRSAIRFCGGFVVLVVVLAPVFGQDKDDYRQFFNPPKTVPEFWKAMNFEIEVGKYDLAGKHLKGLMDLEPKDEELLKIEEKDGMSAFLRLRTIEKWSDNPKTNLETKKLAEDLIEKVSTALKTILSDPQRIARFAANLAATPEERRYALGQLRRSGPLAIPHIMTLLQQKLAKAPAQYAAIVTAMPSLDRNTVPPILAALDINEPIIQENLIDVLRHREDFLLLPNRPETDPAPWLWYIAASPKQPEQLRKKATAALAFLLGVNTDKVPHARAELTRAAERFYNHKVRYPDEKAVPVWRWTDKGLTMDSTSLSKAEEYYGLRYARLALDLDPSFQPAQVIFLSLAVDKGLEGNLDKTLAQGAPKVKELVSTINADLIDATLDRALSERRLPVVLGLTRALGEIGEIRAARPKNQGQSVIVRALNYPDRRVQFAAADALLRLGTAPPSQASGRVVEILRRSVNFESVPKALVADFNKQRGEEVGNALKQAGFEPVVVQSGKQAMRRLAEAGDIDIALIDAKVFDPELRDLLTQLRADVDMGTVPLIITVPPTAEGFRPPEEVLRVRRIAETFRNVWLLDATLDADVYKKVLAARIIEATGQPLTEAERKVMTGEAMVWLKRLAVGEIPGYNVKPAEETILKAMRTDELGALAVEAASRIPTRTAQRALAFQVLDANIRPELRAAAANELNRHIQVNGSVLMKAQVDALTQLFQTTDDAKLKANVALVFGSMRPDAARTGQRLQGYVPAAAEAAPAPAPKEKEKDKEKEKEKEK